jgi:hypothetical protein
LSREWKIVFGEADMQNRNLLHTILIAALCVFMNSCATTNAPPGWLSETERVAADPYGGWVDIQCHHDLFYGELIAVTKDTLFMADSSLHAISSQDILVAHVTRYQIYSLSGVVILGTISTLSHGSLLIISMPLWLLLGSTAAYIRAHEPIIEYPDKPLEELTPFARFPQGLPSELNRQAIKMKYPTMMVPDINKIY